MTTSIVKSLNHPDERRMADGSELELGPGDAFAIGAGHDAWVVGDEPGVTIDFTGLGEFARTAS